MKIRRRRRYQPIEPDEILIDAANLPKFDTNRLEGRIEQPMTHRVFSGFLLVAGLMFSIAIFQLTKLQIVDASRLEARAEANHLHETIIIAERGLITDRNSVPIALNDPNEEKGFAFRKYPLQEMVAHLIGYVSYPKKDPNGFWYETGIEGVVGLERVLNDIIGGTNGVEIQEATAIGEVVSGSVIHQAQSGEEVALSIDADIQRELFTAIQSRAIGGSFRGGSGVIMDIHTGEVIALVSYPSFNPEVLASGGPKETIEEYLRNPNAPFLDRAISGLYTPGSVVKPFVALAALEEGIIDPQKQILSTGSISIPNPYNPQLPTVFRDWKAHGWVDMRQAIAVSSDVYFYVIGGGFEDQQGLGISTIEKYFRAFGFEEETRIPLSGEEKGVIPNPAWKAKTFDGERWFLGNTFHTSIGQYGFQVTPIQLARATAGLANGSFLVEPTVLKDSQGKKEALDIKPENVRIIHEGMRLAVTEGTAAALAIPGVSVAAKTGTAEVGAQKEFINSLVVGFFPYENPQYAFAVVMERAPAGTPYGAPAVMQTLLEWMKVERPSMLGLSSD
ncbi:hypothetical protein COU15_01085 [Candidatus Kaiserbacteria bacterium CG10_big_fil_rev_8_21_14_0_10_45_20]|uniref:Uncharacterized protein n=1 Tax=Candidatus Kaiserbacteria bacterium CG10_big_fil_rev_8_21_14_0_10_45_20 TaxID=1974607 RepID=A0A2H0UIA2_9BACT|nr:MAG: hypothetical protein COU15_01085 [Candidatus Kaiserbacteria bacterium CG10_big_fil_rev_8_21_14_0_10_45_20]